MYLSCLVHYLVKYFKIIIHLFTMGRLCSVINCSTRNSKVTPERVTLFLEPKDDYLKSQ